MTDRGYGHGSAEQEGRTRGHVTETSAEPPGVGKVSLIQLRFGPNTPLPNESGKRTLTEQVVPIQAQRPEPGNATGVNVTILGEGYRA
ncbi:MAG TPA: hypothetical protein VF516_43610 [Kofleriaceae bacterium]